MKPGQYRLRAVVLSRTNYGEADLIANLLTRELGKISGLARHGRKSLRRFGNILAPGTLAEWSFTVRAGHELVRLESGDLLRSHDGLGRSARLLAWAALALELAEAFSPPLDPVPEVFDLLLWTLDKHDRDVRPDETDFIFKVKLLSSVGFSPNLVGCTICGRPPAGKGGVKLSAEAAGLVCASCTSGGFAVSPGTLKTLVLVRNLNPDKLNRLRISETVRREAGPFLLAYLRHILGRELKSARVLEQLGKGCPITPGPAVSVSATA
ncbi:MAG: DNA repair protein RecO [Thermodesulfobacteriota bacterium]